tara:strand:- start:404 stop:1771 length:1368 start_codon:yes stop_codon:yes gene_type:complete
MDNRDCILISWTARDIEGFIFPEIHDLKERFNIIVFVLNISMQDGLKDKLDEMLSEKIIADYYISPNKMHGFSFHLYMKKTTSILRKYNIKLWLFSNDILIAEKYISDNAIKPNTKKVCLTNQLTYLFSRNPAIAKNLISEIDNNKFDVKQAIDLSRSNFRGEALDGFIRNKFRTFSNPLKDIRGFIKYILLKRALIINYFIILINKKIEIVLNFYLYPLIMLGRFHPPLHLRKIPSNESLSQLSNGKALAYIFFDTYEVEAHKKLFKNNNVFLGGIRRVENTQKNEGKVLGLLTTGFGLESNLLPKKILDNYVDNFIKVCNRHKTKIIDLRPHPSMTLKNNHGFQIADNMKNKGFKCRVTSLKNSLIEQAEGYSCVAGPASSALRDILLFNNEIEIIGFESISLEYFKDPIFAFGSSEGIDWINNNGDLVKSRSFHSNHRYLVSEIIINVYNNY